MNWKCKDIMMLGLLATIGLVVFSTAFAEPVVSDIVAKQRYPWNGLVDITCNVSGIDETTKVQELVVSAVMPDSNKIRNVSHLWVVRDGVKLANLAVVQANSDYQLLWDAKADLGEVVYSNMVVRVTLVDCHDKVQLWEGGPYWATTNIGADEPWDYGYYFWWGDTIGYKRVGDAWVASDGSSSNYSFSGASTCNKSVETLKSEGWITEEDGLSPEHDAAHVQWGGNWRMATYQELNDLCYSKCDWIWTAINGVNGYIVCGKGDYASNSIFVPCAGYGYGTSLYNAGSQNVGSHGSYWSSVPCSDYDNSRGFDFGSSYHATYYYSRDRGQSVRPVQGLSDSAGFSVDGVDSAPFMLNTRVAVAITDVTARQRRPWNGKVDINYTMLMEENIPKYLDENIVLQITATDNTTGETYVADVIALSGDTGFAAGPHHVIWDLNAQGLEIKSDDVVFTVAYVDNPLYCIINLSAGANAESYPVSYVADVPSGGWSDEYKTTKLVLRRIEPGPIPTHDAAITKPFYIGVFEVTQKQYELVMGTNPSQYKGDMRPVEQVSYNMIRGSSKGAQWPASSEVDADSFMGRVRAKTGIEEFDLPTEAQWEYACRAGTTSEYNNGGDAVDDLKMLGRYSGNTSDGKGGCSQHTTVGSYLPNAWGVYDMHGNVLEWCLDWWDEALLEGVDPAGSVTGIYRIRRGGYWVEGLCTSSDRLYHYPYSQLACNGFRLANNMIGGSSPNLVLCSADSAAVAIDSRNELVVDSVVVTWDASWIGGDENATVVIEDNGTEIARETGVGEFNHTLSGDGRHDLTYMTYIDGVAQEEIYSAVVFNGSEEPQGITLGDPYCYVDWTKSGDDGALWCREHWDWTDCWADAEDWAVVPINGATDDDELTPVIVYGSADESMVSEVCIEDEATFKAGFKSNIEYDIGHTHTDPNYIKSFVSSRKWLIAKISYKAEKITPKTFFIGLKGGSEYRKFVIVWNHSDGAIEDGYDDASETVALPLPVGSATVSNNGQGARTVTVTPNDGYVVAGWSDEETNTSTVRELQPGKSPYYVTLESEPAQYDETVQYEYEYDSEFGGIVLTDYSGMVPSSLTLPAEIDGQPVVGIGESFMEECDDIVSLTFPDTIRFIGNGAFSWSANIASINMNEGLERIGYDVFDGLQSLEELVIPSTVVSIDRDSFNYSGLGGGGIRSISIRGGDNSYFSADGGMLYDKLNRTVITACANIESAVIPSDCTVIGSEAFAGCSALVSVEFPEPLAYIGGCVFDGCTSLEEVDLSETCVTEIANGAFLSCTSLTEVKMPATLARVGAYLFGGAKSLSKVVYLGNAPQIDTNFGWSYDDIADNAPYFPNGDMYVDYGGEYDSSYLEWITLDRRLTGVVSYVKKGTEGWGEVPGTWQGCPIAYIPEEPKPNFTVTEGVLTHVELNGATEVVIPDGVTGIGDSVFSGCSGLTSVTIPNSVTNIGSSAFYNCSGLTSVTIPDGVTSIGAEAFYNCSGLTSVTIPDSVTSIGDDAFSGCNYVRNATVPGWQCNIPFGRVTNLVISQGTASIRDQAFSGCSGLTSVIIHESVESIGVDAFAGCTNAVLTLGCARPVGYDESGCLDVKEIVFPENPPEYETYAITNVYSRFGVYVESALYINELGILQLTGDAYNGYSGYNQDWVERIGPEFELAIRIDENDEYLIPVTTNDVSTSYFGRWTIQVSGVNYSSYGSFCTAEVVLRSKLYHGTVDNTQYDEYGNQYQKWLPNIEMAFGDVVGSDQTILHHGDVVAFYGPDGDYWYNGNGGVSGSIEIEGFEIDDNWNIYNGYMEFMGTCHNGAFYWRVPYTSDSIGWQGSISSLDTASIYRKYWFTAIRCYGMWNSATAEVRYTILPEVETLVAKFDIGSHSDAESSLEDRMVSDGARIQDPWTSSWDTIVFTNFAYERYGESCEEWHDAGWVVQSGWSFAGWELKSGTVRSELGDHAIAIGTIVPSVEGYIPDGDCELEAVYEAIVYNITFVDEMDAENPNAPTYTVEDCYDFQPPAPVAGWDFLGWDVTGVYNQTGDITVTAQWARSNRTVTFDIGAHGTRTDGGELTQTVVWGESAQAPEVEALQGWRFVGWDADFDTVTDNIIISAVYQELSLGELMRTSVGSFVYNGCEHRPAVIVTDKLTGEQLTERIDYSLIYENNVLPGLATVKAVGINTYWGTLSDTFSILPASFGLSVGESGGFSGEAGTIAGYEGVYDGEGHGLAVDVSAIGDVGVKYALSEEGPFVDSLLLTNVCEQTVWVELSALNYNSFTGFAQVVISQKSIEGCTIEVESPVAYDGHAMQTAVSVIDENLGATLAYGMDYELEYSENEVVGTAGVKVVGKGNYKDEVARTFEVVKGTVLINNESTWQWIGAEGFAFDGTNKTVAFVSDGAVPNEVVEVEITGVTNAVHVGIYTAYANGTITGFKSDDFYNYCYTTVLENVSCTWQIQQRSCDNCDASLTPGVMFHTGGGLEPEITVVDGGLGTTLARGVDYELNFRNNVDIGTAEVDVEFMGDYFGSKTLNFHVVDTVENLPKVRITPQSGIYEGRTGITLNYDGVEGVDCVVRYTLDGSEPTAESPVYSGKFTTNITGEMWLKVAAFSGKVRISEVSVSHIYPTIASIILEDGSDPVAFVNDNGLPWVLDDAVSGLDGRSAMRSSADIANNGESVLSATFNGKGILMFKWKTSCEEDDPDYYDFDHAVCVADGEEVAWLDGISEWVDVSLTFEDEGAHTVVWKYVKDDGDDGEYPGEDCAWLGNVSWTSTSAITLTFDAGDGSVEEAGRMMRLNDPVGELPVPTWAHHDFAGWWTAEGVQVEAGARLYEDTALYAHWTLSRYAVSFDPNGGEVEAEDRQVEYGAAIGELPTPTWEGREFLGWFTAADGGDAIAAETEVFDAVALFAHWRKLAFTVSFNPNGGTASENERTVEFGDEIGALPEASWVGREFLGWFVCETDVQASADTVVTADVSLEARWRKLKYAVTFDPCGGSVGSEGFSIEYEDAVGELPVPTWEGREFLGWFTAAVGGEQVDAELQVTDAVSLFAHWRKYTFTVSFDANGGAVEAEDRVVEYGDMLGELPQPEYEHMEFLGWYTPAGVRVAEDTAVTEDIPLKAEWRYAFSFGGDGEWNDVGGGVWQSGETPNSATNSVGMEVEGEGTIAFCWKVSCEDPHVFRDVEYRLDYLAFAIDGEERRYIYGTTDWASVSFAVVGLGSHVFEWLYVKDSVEAAGYDCGWIRDVEWTPRSGDAVEPAVEGDDEAVVTGDKESGYTVKPSEGKKDVVVTIPEGVEPEKVTVEVSADVETVKANGAKVKVMNEGYDIAAFLDLASVTSAGGVINLAEAKVKDDVAKEALDTASGADINLSPTDPSITTANTRPGLKYTFVEGRTIEELAPTEQCKWGDNTPFKPTPSIKGGTSGFYTIKVEK